MRSDRPDNGEIILVNKPYQWTSFDVVKKLRIQLKIKKIGHAGTLDPLATGLLILCTGKMTKMIGKFQELEKEYTGKMIIGKTTPSFDLETEVDKEYPRDHVTKELLLEKSKLFMGKIMQIPPAYSAIKVGGERAYNKARAGEKIKLDPREVEIKSFELTNINLPEVAFKLVCSKGTYIRSLVRDFGEAIGSGAYLKELCRTRIGEYTLDKAQLIDNIG